jgi:fatty-acyl-CoA synthase
MINSGYRAYELEYALKQSDTAILFLTDGSAKPGEYLEALGQVRENLPALRQVVVLGAAECPDSLSWPEFLARGEKIDPLVLSDREQEVGGDDIFTIQYTSGTTGSPKGARQTHRAYLSNTLSIAERQGLAAYDSLCVPLPFFHAYGCLMVIASLVVGGTVIAIERFRAADMLRAMEQHRATAVSGTPTMFVAALEELASHSYDLTSMRGGNMAGAFCPPDLVLKVIDRMHAPEFGILYGSTEGLVSLMNPAHSPQGKRIGTVGSVMPGYAFKIVDPKTEKEVPQGGQGELCVKGPGVMRDYYRMEEKTAQTLDQDCWLHSGDLASADPDGYVFITGRIKDMIIRGGENVYPAEIEEFLFTHPKIADAQVVGIPCDYYGEDIVAFVRLRQGEAATAIELKKYCRERIAINKVPANFFFVDQYPQTVSGKVQKFKLRELAETWMAESKNKS